MSLGAVLRARGMLLEVGGFIPERQGAGDWKVKAKDLATLFALTTMT